MNKWTKAAGAGAGADCGRDGRWPAACSAAKRRRSGRSRSRSAKRTATVTVYIGKSEDVRTDTSFVELTVGDPEVADVNPLTDRSLSILGKKNGTTRVSAYAEGKKLIGVFDVEVVLRHLAAADRDPRAASRTPASGSPRSTAASCSPAPRPTARPSTRR